MRAIAAVILCALFACAHALPARQSRRTLRQQADDTINGQPVAEVTFRNTCADQGLLFRYSFSFDREYNWFSEKVTSRIPAIFTDYLCAWEPVNYQFAPPDNRMDDPAVQEAIRNGTCFNDQVLLRWPGWKGHGPQSDFSFEYPNGTVWDMYVALNFEDGEKPAVRMSDDGIEETVYRTADLGEECGEGEAGCMQWRKVSLDGLKPTVTFVCAEPASGSSKKSSS
ncbi:hypothetical protein COHA_006270 [Chlorella ohadii]|uniref:Uncharacterized protein n=1 Tax=Chlorella ohadii TaxID=2649997 RepID=A0A5P4NCF9_9CHLO|nr:hypothetical protein COHA_006270 [Chlorella ohadii]QFB70718.1 chloroplast hypothetical protein 1 [Chlorella ohadii]